MGIKELGNQLGIPHEEARSFRETFLNKYTELKDFIETCKKDIETKGYVETLHKRRRYIIAKKDNPGHEEVSKIQRQALNTKIQGSASDIAKMAICKIEREMNKRNIADIYLVLQIHDELVYEVHDSIIEKAKSLIVRCMNACANELSVGMSVNVKIGKNWGNLIPVPAKSVKN